MCVIYCCEYFYKALELNEKKLKILSYVESRMFFIAPNLSTVVGPTTATKLMGKSGATILYYCGSGHCVRCTYMSKNAQNLLLNVAFMSQAK